MEWRTVLTVVLSVTTVVLSVVLAYKFAKRKKPVWARNTRRIIGRGTDAPPELHLTFDELAVHDVYQTVFIFFNKGTETIRKADVAEAVAIHFEGAKILRPPTILAVSKKANKVSVRQLVRDGDETIEIDFLYLDRGGDGVVVEVLHTESKQIRCSGVIMGANEIGYVGEFLPYRPPGWLAAAYATVIVSSGLLLYTVFRDLPTEYPELSLSDKFLLGTAILFMLLVIVMWVRAAMNIPTFYRYLRFPKWTASLKLPLSDETKLR